ncbi:large conductance mechanosensitive channel protein MscL [Kitasatospora sp. NPDC092948]|uniref:large conductance mechanosensitive channel protein MscL n=1 Tax=Kitasatospora sp. NPDC092948 TaxID=3364088 RepID=UPI003823142C
MKGFKEFLLRGNVVDLAVAVVIGAAITNVVNAFVKGIINPLLGLIGTKDLNSYASCLRGPCSMDASGNVTSGIFILWGSVISAVISFIIIAAVVYFLIVLPMNHFLEKRKTVEEEVLEAEEREVRLLTEIRDALVRR